MENGVSLLKQHPLVERVETASLDYGKRFGVALRLKDGTRRAFSALSQYRAFAGAANWLSEGKA